MNSTALLEKFPMSEIKSLAVMLFGDHYEWGGEGTDGARRTIRDTLEEEKYNLTDEEQEILREAVWDVVYEMVKAAEAYQIPDDFLEQYYDYDEE